MAKVPGQSTADHPDDDGSFVDRLCALDRQAWAALYDRHHVQVWRYAYGRIASRDAADDIAAQVFTEALGSIHRYRFRGRPVLAWLYGIAHNLVSKHLRHALKETPLSGGELSGTTPEEGLDAIVLTDALGRLTAVQREVVVLRFYAGYSTREIAAAIGKGEAAVYSLEVRAINALRRQLDRDGHNFLVEANKNSPLPGIDRVT